MIYASPLFWSYLEEYRVLWASGGKGTGKTLFAFALAAHFLRRGQADNLVANVANCFLARKSPFWVEDAPLPMSAIVIVDEAGVAFEKSREIVPLLAYTRHDATYIVLASTIDPPYKARALRVLGLAALGSVVRLYTWQWWGPDHHDAKRPLRSGLLLAYTKPVIGKYKSGIAQNPRHLLAAFQRRYQRLEASGSL